MNALVELDKVGLKRNNKELLHDINWKIMQGEHWCIFGMNGSGKTTLLSVLAGYLSCDTGAVTVQGQKYTEKTILELRKKIGFVSSSFWDKYYCKESVLEIVLSGLSGSFGLTDSISVEDVLRAKTLLNAIGLQNRYYSSYIDLSKGERQNILLARAFINQPEMLVLDEPCNNLDILGREKVLNQVKKIACEEKTTIIYVTHYLEEVLPVFQKMMLLEKGRVLAIGERQTVMKQLEKFLTV